MHCYGVLRVEPCTCKHGLRHHQAPPSRTRLNLPFPMPPLPGDYDARTIRASPRHQCYLRTTPTPHTFRSTLALWYGHAECTHTYRVASWTGEETNRLGPETVLMLGRRAFTSTPSSVCYDTYTLCRNALQTKLYILTSDALSFYITKQPAHT